MLKKSLRTALFSFTAVGALSSSQAFAQATDAAQAAPAAASTGGGLSDIVVTAQRRAENLQNVPVAVTALNQDTLGNFRVTDVSDLTGLAPNLQILSQGLQSIPTISIRGISSGVSNNSVDPKVGIYLDGVYIGRSVGAIFDLADIERVEVLRGPQGTLFGRNATGGAISLVTAAPTGEFGVNAYASYGNYDAFRTRVTVNLPALGPLSVKVTYLHDQNNGYMKNLIGGRSINLSLRDPSFGTLTYGDRFGAKNVNAFQVAARLQATDNLTVDYKFDYTQSKTMGSAVQLLGTPAGPTAPLAGGILAFQPLFGGITNLSTTRLDPVANATSPEDLNVQGHNVTVTLHANDNLEVKSITGVRSFDQQPNIFDLAGTGGIRFTAGQLAALLQGNVPGVFNPAVAPGPNDSMFSLLTSRKTRQKQFSEELQFVVTTKAIDLTAGLFYFHERSPATDILGIFQPVANGVVIPTPFDSIFGSGVTESIAVNSSMAAYAQGTYHVTPKLDITLGGRFTADNRETILIRTGSPGVGGGGILPPGTYKKSYEKFNYTGILTYRPTGDITAYAKIATGYVAGGILSAIPYNPETVASYELGLKSELFNRRLRANFAGFYVNYKDLQIQTFQNGVQRFENAGKARIWGVEAEIDAIPVERLTLSGTAGYTDFKYLKYVSELGDITDIVRANYIPKWNVRLSGQYDFPEFGGGGNMYFRMDGRWQSKAYPGALPTGVPALDALAVTRPYWIVDGRFGLVNLPMGGVKLGASLWVKNLLDKNDVFVFGPQVINQTAEFLVGRTFGADVTVKF
ncbi:TonB-dependent receptor [Sphingomonas lycopersici]|uniref:TonB-dependent receptor n=1 Tax=Sphingomonas lycopersici TaxID=2951807 RepID=A0AA41Z8I5_9SPHN|nr:TonB-dependent receptor [Sphingomonas lycopersici]MCW6534839.1 TonB-dependent receptor [Sphingomonas lycopersici]